MYADFTYTLGANLENIVLIGTANITATGSSAANILLGNAGDNTLRGGGGADTIDGGAGNDLIYGDGGNDVLTGGAGADQFYFTDENIRQIDTITDFQSGVDRIVLVNSPNNFAANDFNYIRGHSVQIGADLRLDVDADVSIILSNRTIAQISAADFLFLP